MDRRSNITMTLMVIALLVLSGLAPVAWSAVRAQIGGGADEGADVVVANEPAEVTLQIDQYLLGADLMGMELPGGMDNPLVKLNGTVYPLWGVLLVLTVVIIGATVAMAMPLALIYSRLDNTTTAIKEADEFREKVAQIEQAEKEFVKANREAKPPTGMPSHEMPRWSVISTSLIAIFMSMMAGAALSDSFSPDGSVTTTALIFGLIALIICAIVFRPRQLLAVDQTDYNATDWGTIWVILSGVIFVGVGVGLMIAIRAAGG